jgi:long-chain acyl-CoA synthetase
MNPSPPAFSAPSLIALLFERASEKGDRPALGVKRAGQYVWLTWNEILADVRQMAARLRSAGLAPGDRLLLVSENRYEWVVCDLAVHLARGIHVAVHNTLAGPQIAEQMRDSGARLVVVAGTEQAQKLAAAASLLPNGLQFLSFDPVSESIAGQPVRPLAAIDAELFPTIGPLLPAPEDLATILYTSGTTGEPQGVMLTHRNLTFNAAASLAAFEPLPNELRLSWLPLSHIYARTADLYTWLTDGSQLALAESRETLLADCAAVRPTFLNGVPYFYEKVARHLSETGRAAEPGALAALLGGRIHICCSGGAALPNHVAEFFARSGVPLVQGYGLTETSPVITTCSLRQQRMGTVGPPIPGVEVAIAPDGEILTRGPHVMQGYWHRPEATAAALRDGWFHTGDLGSLEEGYLRITGRKKELIVTAGGKNIAPAHLEALLVADPLVAQAMVIGEGKKYLAALIVPDRDRLRAEIIAAQIPVTSAAEAIVHPRVRALYEAVIVRCLAGVSRDEQVREFVLLDRGFTIETGELTPTLKLRRAVVLQQFAEQIAQLYAR